MVTNTGLIHGAGISLVRCIGGAEELFVRVCGPFYIGGGLQS